MDTSAARHITLKKIYDIASSTPASLHALFEESARTAFAVPWHRLARGLRLSRLRNFVNEIAPTHHATEDEKTMIFTYLQKALDRKALNTSKTVNYDITQEKITAVKGLEIKRNTDGVLKITLSAAAKRGDGITRKKKKDVETTNAEI